MLSRYFNSQRSYRAIAQARLLHHTRMISNSKAQPTNIAYTPPDLSKVNAESWPSKYTNDLQEEITEYIDWKMSNDWSNMSSLDKKTAYFLAFGKYGPRSDKKDNKTPMEQLFEMIYKSIIFGALSVSVYQIFKDKQFSKKIEYLEQQL